MSNHKWINAQVAACSCGWTGEKVHKGPRADVEAMLEHSAHAKGCMPGARKAG